MRFGAAQPELQTLSRRRDKRTGPVNVGLEVMRLRLHNTLTRSKELFVPLDPADVRLYVCGPTVYDRAHIGNARPVIVFDVLFRLLRHLYGAEHVRYARNITDVDDKIIVRAAESGIAIDELTEATTRQYHDDVDALGCLSPTIEPRATQHIPEMIAVIERLMASGHAYESHGHVLFNVPSMPAYGRLSNRSLDEMIAGARVEVAPYKRGDTDFVLWKPALESEPGWPSPWGRGRPGWHVECSAMSWKHFGETFDIHGGGLDLIFPHHENEIAQSCCAFDTPLMARTWVHNGFLQVEGQKMSKSLGNFITIREVLDQHPNDPGWGEIVRLNMLRTHYRQPIDWTERGLNESRVIYTHLMNAVRGAARDGAGPNMTFLDWLADDLNTPAALGELQLLAKRTRSGPAPGEAVAELIGSLDFLGFKEAVRFTSEASGSGAATLDEISDREAREAGLDPELIRTRIAERLAARAAKNWAESDRIRDELAASGVILKDTKTGTTDWSVGRKG